MWPSQPQRLRQQVVTVKGLSGDTATGCGMTGCGGCGSRSSRLVAAASLISLPLTGHAAYVPVAAVHAQCTAYAKYRVDMLATCLALLTARRRTSRPHAARCCHTPSPPALAAPMHRQVHTQ
eukprot:360103-Chlamydomonas_euryale.AAC.2